MERLFKQRSSIFNKKESLKFSQNLRVCSTMKTSIRLGNKVWKIFKRNYFSKTPNVRLDFNSKKIPFELNSLGLPTPTLYRSFWPSKFACKIELFGSCSCNRKINLICSYHEKHFITAEGVYSDQIFQKKSKQKCFLRPEKVAFLFKSNKSGEISFPDN